MPRKLPRVGDVLTIRVKVTRVGRNVEDTADTVTIRMPGHDVPVTVEVDRLMDAED